MEIDVKRPTIKENVQERIFNSTLRVSEMASTLLNLRNLNDLGGWRALLLYPRSRARFYRKILTRVGDCLERTLSY